VQHADAVREKSAAESKSQRLTEKLAAMEAEKGELRCQLVEERREANKAIADAHAAQADAKLARAEGSLACQCTEDLEARLNSLRNRVYKAEASTRTEVTRTHAQFVDAYRELGRVPPPSKRPTKRWASASSSGYRRSWRCFRPS
jgi:chromosome segregation ATPase